MKPGPLSWEPREPEGISDDPTEAGDAAQKFREFAAQAVERLPLYRRLCEGAADDREVAARILLADTPGPTRADIRKLPYTRVTRPLSPLDDI